jgi:hypothetical protein
MKICSTCTNKLDYSYFYKSNNTKDGFRYECKSCVKQKSLKRNTCIKTENTEAVQKKRETNKQWYIKNKERIRAKSKYNHIQQRKRCITHYGAACACCGESTYEFLVIDHINGGGNKQRKEGITKISRWLIANNFPEGFRILCHNCNSALGAYGYCPHSTTPE